MLEKRGKGKKAKGYVVFHILESGSFFPPRIEKPGLVVPCRQSFENTPPITNLLPHRCIYPRFSTIFHHFEYKGGGGGREGCAARNFPSGKSGKAGKKKIGVDRGGNNDALENYLRDKARDTQTYPLHLPPSSTFDARDFFPRPSITSRERWIRVRTFQTSDVLN